MLVVFAQKGGVSEKIAFYTPMGMNMAARAINRVFLSMVVLLLGSTQVHAAGFYLREVGTPGSVGATVYLTGDAPIDQAEQGVRTTG